MAVPNVPRKIVFPANGTGPYSFNFKVHAASQVAVQRRVGNTISDLTSPADYSIVLTNGGVNGGIITLTDGLTGSDVLLAEARTTIDQQIPFANLGAFNAQRHEVAYDKLTFIAQEQDAKQAATIKIPAIDENINTTLPTADLRANKALIFDANGNVTVSTMNFNDAELQGDRAQRWASYVGGLVDGIDYSSRAYAIGGTGTETNNAKYFSQLTAADRVQTGADRVQTGIDAAAASASAAAAAASAAQGMFREVVDLTFADSPYTPVGLEEGILFRVNTSGGAVSIVLDSLANYDEDMKFAFVKEGANNITITTSGGDTLVGGLAVGNTVTVTEDYQTHVLIGDLGNAQWFDIIQSAAIPDASVALTKLVNQAQATFIGRKAGAGTGSPQVMSAAEAGAILGLDAKADKLVTIVSVAANKTLALTDKDVAQEVNVSSDVTITIPPNSSVAFPIGTQIPIYRLSANNAAIIAAGAGVTLLSEGGALVTRRLRSRYSSACLLKIRTDQWLLIGDLELI